MVPASKDFLRSCQIGDNVSAVGCLGYYFRMGRPATKSGEIVSVNINGRGVAWCDGVFSGDREIVEHARKVSDSGLVVSIQGVEVTANDYSPQGAFAAIFSFNPNQAILIDASDATLELASVGHSWDSPNSWA